MDSLAKVGFRFRVSAFGLRSCSVFRKGGGAVGASTPHIANILGCGKQDVLTEIRVLLATCFGAAGLQESSSVCVGMEQSQETDLSVKLTQEELTTNQKPLKTSPGLGAALQRALSLEASSASASSPEPAQDRSQFRALRELPLEGFHGRAVKFIASTTGSKMRSYGSRRRH